MTCSINSRARSTESPQTGAADKSAYKVKLEAIFIKAQCHTR